MTYIINEEKNINIIINANTYKETNIFIVI